jgi:hypothetical protein
MDGKDAHPEKQDAAQEPKVGPRAQEVVANSHENVKAEDRENNTSGKHKPTEHIKWTDKVQATCAILLVLITFVYTYYTRGQVKSAVEATTENLRPWIKIKSIGLVAGHSPVHTLMFHLQFPGKQTSPAFLLLSLSLENVGHTVAQDVYILPYFFSVL